MFSYVISSIVFVDFVTLKEEESSTNYLKTLINRNTQTISGTQGCRLGKCLGSQLISSHSMNVLN